MSADTNIQNIKKDSFFEIQRQTSEELELTDRIFLRALNKYKKLYKLFNDSFQNLGFDEGRPQHIEDLNYFVRFFAENVNDFLKNKKGREYILHETNGYKLQGKISNLVNEMIYYEHRFNKNEISDVILNYTIQLNTFLEWFDNYQTQVEIRIESDEIIEKLNKEIRETKSDLNKINSEKTEEIYSTASAYFLDAARNYEVVFYLLLFASFLFTIISLSIYPYSEENKINFIITKIITITLVITLGTLFLRKAAHLRKLHEQANQTSLELQALPIYLRNVNPSEHSEIYKNLAENYFGKELDQTQNDKIGDLMKDQLAAGTELIKASAEIVKIGKPSVEK